MMPAEFRLLTSEDFTQVEILARRIWQEHYLSIISQAQIDYMLEGRFSADRLKAYLNASDKCWYLVFSETVAVGYFSYARTDEPDEGKLEQLYLLRSVQGRGWGKLMLKHVEQAMMSWGCSRVMLTVNKHNRSSIAVYRKAGFTIREEAVFDIGNGYVMDDFVMVKSLSVTN